MAALYFCQEYQVSRLVTRADDNEEKKKSTSSVEDAFPCVLLVVYSSGCCSKKNTIRRSPATLDGERQRRFVSGGIQARPPTR